MRVNHLYIGYFPINGKPNCLVTVNQGIPNCLQIPPGFMCAGGFRELIFNPFNSPYFPIQNSTNPAFIVGAQANVWDSIASPYAQFSVQRNSDWAMILNVNAPGGQGTNRAHFDGTYTEIKPNDALLLESSCNPNSQRVIALDLLYTFDEPSCGCH